MKDIIIKVTINEQYCDLCPFYDCASVRCNLFNKDLGEQGVVEPKLIPTDECLEARRGELI